MNKGCLITSHVKQAIYAKDYVFISGNQLKTLKFFTEKDFIDFSSLWNNLTIDQYMQDKGTYRYRRFGTFIYDSENLNLIQQPHRPSFQPDYINPLNGNIVRHFNPLEIDFVNNQFFINLLSWLAHLFNMLVGKQSWDIRVHPYRIIAEQLSLGLPTPEGIHRDGVNYVISLMINRVNISGGQSGIYDNEKNNLDRITLASPLDIIIANDKRTMHDVSPIKRLDNDQKAYRDVLVIGYTVL